MPLSTKEAQREYQRLWIKRRREEWLKVNGPCVDCSSWENLEVDHVDPSTKEDHKVWSWSEQRRAEELKKCVVRCEKCHKKKTSREREQKYRHGTYSMWIGKKCRCIPCIMAQREYKRIYRAAGGVH